MKRAFILHLAFLLLLSPLSACSSGPAKPSVSPPSATATLPVMPTQSPTPTPTPTPAPPPLPAVPELIEEYRQGLALLVPDLVSAQQVPADLETPAVDQVEIVLVPLQSRLYYPQALLYPEWSFPRLQESPVLYVTYQFSRGAELVYGFVPLPWADTQEAIVDLRAILRLEETYYLLEETHNVGGEGSSAETELVERAVAPLETLAEVGEQVEQILECILGYASGAGGTELCPAEHATNHMRVTLLVHTLDSEDWSDWRAAADSLAFFGREAEPAIPHLIDLLSYRASGAEAVIDAALYALDWITEQDWGEDAAVWLDWLGHQYGGIQGMVASLNEADVTQRRMAITMLKLYQDEANQALPALIGALQDPDLGVRASAIELLSLLGAEASESVPGLILVLQDDENSVLREEAANALMWIGSPEAIPALISALLDPSPWVSEIAAYALGAFGSQASAAIPHLIQILESEDVDTVRAAAANSLGKLQAFETVPLLIRTFQNEDGIVRWGAIIGIGSMGVQAMEAVPALIELLATEEGFMQTTISLALEDITGEDFGPDVDAWQEWWEAQD